MIEQIDTPFEIYNHLHNEFVATFPGAANVLLGRWREGRVSVGGLRLKAPAEAPVFSERQPVKVVFRPEDVSLNFQPQFLDTPFYLGSGVVEDISYTGPTERLVVRLTFKLQHDGQALKPKLTLADERYDEGVPIAVLRTKWEAAEMNLSVDDQVRSRFKGLSPADTLPAEKRIRGEGPENFR